MLFQFGYPRYTKPRHSHRDSSNRPNVREQMHFVYPCNYVELSCSMVKPLWLVEHGLVLVPLPRKNGARRSSGFTMLWRLCRRRHSSWTSRSSFFLSSGGKDTSRAARAPPLRDAYCTLDKAIYRSWVLLAQVCLCSRACCIAPMQRCTPRFPWNATILPILDRLPYYGFSKPLGMVVVFWTKVETGLDHWTFGLPVLSYPSFLDNLIDVYLKRRRRFGLE